ncbi:hypothetical protein HPP92_006924 [Vanilla planifolia]|uniref:Uncharacterized protein n=1 Tax=Vanilla planifolia TaxID=51239 RepID=A0A835RCW7_VANPL|nr:hypothetical protein HPP92_006924 [Vanilla planifolia]
MADSSAQSDEIKGERLKYLDFVQEAVIRAVVLFSSLYAFAKHNAGPLRQGVQNVEDTVKAVVNPVYEKLRDVPFEFLKFLDRKLYIHHRRDVDPPIRIRFRKLIEGSVALQSRLLFHLRTSARVRCARPKPGFPTRRFSCRLVYATV